MCINVYNLSMKNKEKTIYKRIHINMNIDMYNVLKELCDERGATVTKYILRAISTKMKLETSKE